MQRSSWPRAVSSGGGPWLSANGAPVRFRSSTSLQIVSQAYGRESRTQARNDSSSTSPARARSSRSLGTVSDMRTLLSSGRDADVIGTADVRVPGGRWVFASTGRMSAFPEGGGSSRPLGGMSALPVGGGCPCAMGWRTDAPTGRRASAAGARGRQRGTEHELGVDLRGEVRADRSVRPGLGVLDVELDRLPAELLPVLGPRVEGAEEHAERLDVARLQVLEGERPALLQGPDGRRVLEPGEQVVADVRAEELDVPGRLDLVADH